MVVRGGWRQGVGCEGVRGEGVVCGEGRRQGVRQGGGCEGLGWQRWGGGEGGHKEGEASLGVASGPCAGQTNNRPSIVLPGGG